MEKVIVRDINYKLRNRRGFSYSDYNNVTIICMARHMFDPQLTEELGDEWEVEYEHKPKEGRTFNG
jgi:hypothetical protein